MEFTVIRKLSYKAMVQQRKWEKILYFQNPIRLNKGFSGIKMLLKKIQEITNRKIANWKVVKIGNFLFLQFYTFSIGKIEKLEKRKNWKFPIFTIFQFSNFPIGYLLYFFK